MTAYSSSPFRTGASLIPGDIGFSFGSFDTHDPGTKMSVSNVALTSNVATLTVQILEGKVPVVGQLISAQGLANSEFNVTNVAIASVSISSSTGAGTLTFALTHANVTSVADVGIAIAAPLIIQEALVAGPTAGKQFAIAEGNIGSNGQRGITWFTQFSGSPATVTMLLQGADVDQDSQYSTVDESTVVGGETRSLANVNYQFYRINAASTGGTTPTVAAGIMVR